MKREDLSFPLPRALLDPEVPMVPTAPRVIPGLEVFYGDGIGLMLVKIRLHPSLLVLEALLFILRKQWIHHHSLSSLIHFPPSPHHVLPKVRVKLGS